jgi:hypothetical protein
VGDGTAAGGRSVQPQCYQQLICWTMGKLFCGAANYRAVRVCVHVHHLVFIDCDVKPAFAVVKHDITQCLIAISQHHHC